MLRNVILPALCLTLTLISSARAQAPPVPAGAAPAQTARDAQRPASYDRAPDQSELRYRTPSPRRTSPMPDDDSTWGWRNPGGVGRRAQWYPPNNQFQNPGRASVGAQFDQGPVATQRAAQATASSLGIQRANSIQNHIDVYGRPMGFGFGYGLGFGGFGFPVAY
jgi:hypothetical protein